MSDTVEKTRNGAIVYDTAIINQISERAFVANGWPHAKPIQGPLRSAGRGKTLMVSDGQNEFVLRHYLRGGLPGKLIRDSYLWLGENKTRSFAEWYLLAKLHAMGLPVPRPAAARYRRKGIFYTADLLTIRLPDIRSLAERIVESPGNESLWKNIGAVLYRFHAAGVDHADLNAYNVQVGNQDSIYLLDFDRGRILPPGPWQQKNIARLHRSLRKIKLADRNVHYTEADWNLLLDSYFNASRSA
ncbi:MAG: 3-deoxy-D-manno-octulosonic acid kinase [Woeseiaceae bacterium]|nr:3-deoxy-D-manno-octulosonic acid kinase [Woeseiaceae bacterium]